MLFITKSYILIIKPTRRTNFSNLFWNRNLRVSDRFTVHHQESTTVYTAIGVCHTGYADCLLARSGWKILISLLDSWWWTVNLSETCRVLFPQNKFEKSVHLVGFIVRIYHDARSSECQISRTCFDTGVPSSGIYRTEELKPSTLVLVLHCPDWNV